MPKPTGLHVIAHPMEEGTRPHLKEWPAVWKAAHHTGLSALRSMSVDLALTLRTGTEL
jgi:hypothetical protein